MSTGAPPVPVHPALAGLQFLLGTWAGEGEGHYPTVAPFAYGEEMRFWEVGKPFLAYSQRTWALDDNRPLHAEAGYWRPTPDGGVELVVAHPSGHVEIEEGAASGTTVTLASRLVAGTRTAKPVSAMRRQLVVDGDELRYTLGMEAVGESLQQHLTAVLRRAP